MALFGSKSTGLALLRMRFVSWDDNLAFDDPNLRWGSPSYLLEPGDPGYVGPIPVSKPLTKRSLMKHEYWYPRSQPDQIVWLTNFSAKLGGYATALSLLPATVTAAVADCGWLKYLLEQWLPEVRSWEKSCTAANNFAQSGTGASTVSLPTFTAPALPTGVTAQLPGALARISALVQDIKNSGKATDAIQADLRIVGSVDTGPDEATLQPSISAKVSGSAVNITWGWNGYHKWLQSCEIMVDRGDGKGFVALVMDTTPNYIDTEPFPSKPTIWAYKAIYRADDKRVGLWSQTASVTVGS
jgi:hypothetical protein